LKKAILFFWISFSCVFFNNVLIAQSSELVKITGVLLGNDTSDALFKVSSSTIPLLHYIRAQRIAGPQNGIFTQNKDNIRYTAISDTVGMPYNLSRIRFSFLQEDKKTLIPLSSFRFVINDIDGPNNEALATNCNANLKFIGTANPSNVIVDNSSSVISARGSVDENEGPTSRVMFQFYDVAIVEFNNYANDGYLKDFDLNNDYPIPASILVKCIEKETIKFKKDTIVYWSPKVLKKDRNLLMINTAPIYFDFNKYNIRNDALFELTSVLNLLKQYSKLIVEIRSHTDARDNDDYNLKLSNNRAKSTVEWFVKNGINTSRITGKGYGETQLVNKCTNGVKCSEEEHQLNRRTEFVIVNPEGV